MTIAATLRFCEKVLANQQIVNSPGDARVVDTEKRSPDIPGNLAVAV
jgi:hypothetical protein